MLSILVPDKKPVRYELKADVIRHSNRDERRDFMSCQGPDCINTEKSQPSANQTVFDRFQINVVELLAKNPAMTQTYGLLLLARETYSHARLIEDHDRALSRKLDGLASIFGEEAIAAGLKAAPGATKSAMANNDFLVR